MRKRIISMVIALVMTVNMVPLTAFATETIVNDAAMTQEEQTKQSDEGTAAQDTAPESSLEERLDLEEKLSEANAVPEESTENATVFDLGDGKKTIVYHSQDVRFKEDGELTDYDPALVKVQEKKSEEGEDLSAYSYTNKTGDSSHYLPKELGEDSQILMEKDGYSIKLLPLDNEVQDQAVALEKEETLTAYETVEEKPVVAVYETKDQAVSYEYTSLNKGIKESIVLQERPESNVFRFSLEVTGMYAEVDEEENTILLLKKEEGASEEEQAEKEVVAVIDRPFMNDATEEAYSEDLTYALQEEKEGKYLLTLTASRSYLDAEERVYPVTIDPTMTWKGDGEFLDVYVLNGSYADMNFYASGTTVMPVGKGDKGTYRTYIKLPGIKNDLAGKYIDSAYMTVYETGACDAGQKIRVNRITENWNVSTLTWNNKPAHYTETYNYQFTTNGTTYKSHKITLTAAVRNFINSTNNPNYGFVLRNMTDDQQYAVFFGSRYAVADYRPKLVITYYDKPTAPATVGVSRKNDDTYVKSSYVKKAYRIFANWTGIKSQNLTDVQFKFTGVNGTAQPTSVTDSAVDLTVYRSMNVSTKDGANVKIPYSYGLPTGVYRFYLRGKDAGGMFGAARYKTIYVDGDTPTLTNVSVSPVTSESAKTTNCTPTISWTASDTYFSKVTISVDGKTAKTAATAAGAKSYTLPAGTIQESGLHTIKVTAHDKAGKSKSKTLNYYVGKLDDLQVSTDPETSKLQCSSNLRPTISWTSNVGSLSKAEVYVDGKKQYTTTDSSVTSYQLPQGVLTASGVYTIVVKATDSGGNELESEVKYHLDVDKPIFESLSITPQTNSSTPSGNRSPVFSWNITDTKLSSISYSLNGTQYQSTGLTDKTSFFVLPSETWGTGTGEFTVYVKAIDTAGNESDVAQLKYYLNNSTDYVPKNLTVTESYGKHIIRWNFDGYDDRKKAYDIHRGTASGFTPSQSTLLAADIDAAECRYIDPSVLSDGTYYYKIAVKDLAGGSTVYSSAISTTVQNAQKDLANTLGSKEYLSYLDMGLPMGTIQVEESSGNLIYSQSEFDVSNAGLSYGLGRTYNSQSKRTSMFGTGWMDSWHRELSINGTNIYYTDSDGSCYLFTQNGGTYSCGETKEYTLSKTDTGYKIVTKDEHVFTFNEAGQIIHETEPNGCTVSYRYDLLGRLAYVISEEDKSNERKLVLIYDGNSQLLQSVKDFAGTSYQYTYTGNLLTKVTIAGTKGSVSYEYSYTGNLLSGIRDGMDNLYSITYNNGKAVSLSYPDGEKFVLTYGSGNTKIEKYTPGQKKLQEETVTYDTASGKLLTFTDAKGAVTTYTYDTNRPYLVAKITNTSGYQTIDENGTVQFQTENVTETVYTYDDNENVTKEVSSDGTETTYTYADENNENLVTKEYSEKENKVLEEVTYTYDEQGNLTETEDLVADTLEEHTYVEGELVETKVSNTDVESLSGEETVAPEDTTEEVSVTAEENVVGAEYSTEGVSTTEYKYDLQGNVTKENTKTGTVSNEAVIKYDAMGRQVKSEENGVVTTTDYDFLGRDIETTVTEEGKADVVVTKTYNANSSLTKETESTGVTKNYTYDSRNRLLKTTTTGTDIGTNTTENTYGYAENVTIKSGTGEVTEPILYKEEVKNTAGTVISTTYTDALGRAVKEASGTTYTDYTYDASGNSVVSYEGNTQNSQSIIYLTLYDEEGRSFAEITAPQISSGSYSIGADTIVTYTAYNEKGEVETETDALGVVTSYEYDEEGQLVFTDIAGDGKDLQVDYQTIHNGQTFVTITDARGHIRQEITDAFGQTVETRDVADETNAQSNIITDYVYDDLGRLERENYGDGTYKVYQYDGTSERVSSETEYLADGTAESRTEHTYDAQNRLTKTVHKEGTTAVCEYTYTYDAADRILSETVKYGSEDGRATAYEYDAEGRLIKMTYPSASGIGTVTYSYDDFGNTQSIRKDGALAREYLYDAFYRVTTIKDYDKPGSTSYIQKNYTYDALGRTVSAIYLEDGNTSKVVESYTYTYDKNDNILSETRISNLPAEAARINETRAYVYDSYGRLIESTITDHTASDAQTVTAYEYDAVGNREKKTEAGVETEYTYNELNQLLTMSGADGEVTYTYDCRGNQIEESNSTTGETIETTYNVAGEMVELVKKTTGTTTFTQTNVYNQDGIRISRTQGTAKREYYYNNGVVSYTEDNNTLSASNLQSEDGSVIGTYRNNTYYGYLKNLQGSTAGIISESGGTAAVYAYSDFGETEEVVADSIGNEICYTGAIYDKDTGLYYMNARYYDAVTGRFISQDSYRGEMEDEGTWHLYVYCSNDPVNCVDLSGHKWVKFSTILKNGKRNNKYAKRVLEQYYKNMRKCNTKYLITNQFTSTFSKMKFAKTDVRTQGCGIIAIHNIRYLLGEADYFSKLVAEFDYNMITSGKQGIFIGTVDLCLDSYLKSNYYVGRKNIERKIEERKYGVVRVKWNNGRGHFFAVEYEAKMFMAYNVKNGRKTATASNLKNLEKKINGTISMGLAVRK